MAEQTSTDVEHILATAKSEKALKQTRDDLARRKKRVAERLGGEVHARASAFGEAARVAPRLEDALATARSRLDRAVSAVEACARESERSQRKLRSHSGNLQFEQQHSNSDFVPSLDANPSHQPPDSDSQQSAPTASETEALLRNVRDEGSSLRPETRTHAAAQLDALGYGADAHRESLLRRKERMRAARRAATPPEQLPALVVEQLAREIRGGSKSVEECFSDHSSRMEELHTWALREAKEVTLALSESANEVAPSDARQRIQHLRLCVILVRKALLPAARESAVPVYEHLAEAVCTIAMLAARSLPNEQRSEALLQFMQRPSSTTLERVTNRGAKVVADQNVEAPLANTDTQG